MAFLPPKTIKRDSEEKLTESGKYQESDFAHELLDSDVGKAIAQSESICIDITGFIKPYMMALLFQRENMGKKRIEILFSEPSKYKDKANTKFAGNFFDIRPVAGYGGVGLSTGTEKEILVIGAGYDNNLIAGVADEKTSAIKKYRYWDFLHYVPICIRKMFSVLIKRQML